MDGEIIIYPFDLPRPSFPRTDGTFQTSRSAYLITVEAKELRE